MPVLLATINDIPAIATLINSAYRGEASKKGWTTEADLLVGGLRTDIPTLTDLLNKPQSVILKYISKENIILGSVFLEVQERGLYLGMLSVSPLHQAEGVGKQLMLEAENYAKENNCSCIFMNVISIRHELIAWYERQGYCKTGEMKPLLIDKRFGVPAQPLEFAMMEKRV